MKKLFILAASMLLAICAHAQDGKSIYNKFSDEPGVSAVYISPSMFKMIGALPSIDIGEGGEKMDLTPIVKSLKGFYLLNSSNPSIAGKMEADAKKLIKSGSYELMMEAKSDGETVRIYTDGDDHVIRSFVMMASDGSESTFISMDGLISRSDLERLMEATMY